MKKLIFLLKPEEDRNYIQSNYKQFGLKHPTFICDLDIEIKFGGIFDCEKNTQKLAYDWYMTSYPHILNWHIWHNRKTDKMEIYFLVNKKLVNIHELNSFRPSQNIEKLFLSRYFI